MDGCRSNTGMPLFIYLQFHNSGDLYRLFSVFGSMGIGQQIKNDSMLHLTDTIFRLKKEHIYIYLHMKQYFPFFDFLRSQRLRMNVIHGTLSI